MRRREIARLARKACERYYETHRGLDIYEGLGGMCAMASVLLSKMFKKHGYDSTIVLGHFNGATHCWIESGSKVYDITYTQFKEDGSKVYVFNNENERYEDKRYEVLASFDDNESEEFQEHFNIWPDGQQPSSENLMEIENVC
jgi:hypothetical protein